MLYYLCLWYYATCCHITVAVFFFSALMLCNVHDYCSVNFAKHFTSQHYAAELFRDPWLACSLTTVNYSITIHYFV